MEHEHRGPPLGRRAGVVQELSFEGDKPLPKTPQKISQPVTVVLARAADTERPGTHGAPRCLRSGPSAQPNVGSNSNIGC
jgi:hypothetical protein